MSDKLKKLTGKNPKDFELEAKNLINNCDTELFSELVEKDDFLFDYIKQNVAKRIEKACNKNNYLNLLQFLNYYSPSYEDCIVSVLTTYADEDLTDKMLEIFENGNENEKTYCAKFFSVIKDPLALDLLKKYAFSQNSYLCNNCIATLASFGDKTVYEHALNILDSNKDEFEKYNAVKMLVSFGDKNATAKIIETAKNSSLAEYIASEIPYLSNLYDLIINDKPNGLYILNLIIEGLGEVTSFDQIFDYQLYEIFEYLISNKIESKSSVILLKANEKFNTITENDEYLYDETKDVKQEIQDIKNLLFAIKNMNLCVDDELDENSLFVFSALDLTTNISKVKNLLNSNNPTIILKAIEVLKRLNALTKDDKNIALECIKDENISNIIIAI